MNMDSLGMIDLDLSISPDVFGLRAFDATKPVTRMLPGSSPCELRLMLPDDKLGIDGFHDILVENLSGKPPVVARFAGGYDFTAPAMAEGGIQHPTTPGVRCGASAPG